MIPWDKNYETKIPLFDDQNKRFLLKANLFYVKCKVNSSFEECEKDLSYLEKLFLSHFSEEENLQKELDYPHFHHHQASHDRLRGMVRDTGTHLRSSSFSNKSLQEFHNFIESFVKEHLVVDDIKFARYYQEKTSS